MESDNEREKANGPKDYFLIQKEEHKQGGNTQIDCGPGALEILVLSAEGKPTMGGLT
jgi:hypothetical protein